MNHAGRRSYKSETEKRRGAYKGLNLITDGVTDANIFFTAPTFSQAKAIYWDDIKKLIPPRFMLTKPSETELKITLVTGATLYIAGMDKPERIEGRPIDHIVVDEFDNMKRGTWEEHIRPGLYTLGRKPGTASIIGVPEGRGMWYEIVERAKSGEFEGAEVYHWHSDTVLPPEEISAARSQLDDLTFRQEYGGEFVAFSGRAYYSFDIDSNCRNVKYVAGGDLILCFDFNVDPGVCVVCQEQIIKGRQYTCVIGEVYIPKNSNTQAVCLKLLQDWAFHDGPVYCYGDASGGSRHTTQTNGSDWDIIRGMLRPRWGVNLMFDIPRANPAERSRVNAVNSRCKSVDGHISLLVNGKNAGNLVRDLDGVALLDGGAGQIDKKKNKMLTHLSDALGYYIVREFPVGTGGDFTITEL